ncbi:hypothetical protein TGPRC2_358530 [Toxoplasma gondii TgCatPRC2]|uniref:KRUF family protein n=2 Tax=Toxoplasma gondii TaxID=5811 RepID=A0A151GZU3_TOXGO|nr:hypothetical protein TGMAS_358530 [Toxoplasma gondii MAS]KYK62523.1 hypothetical protein TGPRC2_358530 [Toxoplasma gondii TgCatPRC2]
MIRENDRSPAASTQLHWKQQDRGNYHRFFSRRQAQVQELESQALILEQELHSLLSSSSGPETEPPPDFESASKTVLPPWTGLDLGISMAFGNTQLLAGTRPLHYLGEAASLAVAWGTILTKDMLA